MANGSRAGGQSGRIDCALQHLQADHRAAPATGTDAVGTYAHWSFPSGHATQCMAFFAMLIVLACFAGWAQLRLWGTAAAAVVLVVGTSRIYLGAHWFTDVLGGYALGGAWVSLLTVVCLKTTLRAPPLDR